MGAFDKVIGCEHIKGELLQVCDMIRIGSPMRMKRIRIQRKKLDGSLGKNNYCSLIKMITGLREI